MASENLHRAHQRLAGEEPTQRCGDLRASGAAVAPRLSDVGWGSRVLALARSAPQIRRVFLAARPPRAVTLTHIALVLLCLALLAAVVLPLWEPLLMATVVAALLRAPYERLVRALSGRRQLAATFSVMALLVIVLAPLAALVAYAIARAPQVVELLGESRLEERLGRWIAIAPAPLDHWLRGALDQLTSGAMTGANLAAAAVTGALAATSNVIFKAVMLLIALFFLLCDGPRLVTWMTDLSPLGRARTLTLLLELRRATVSTLACEVATALVQAAVATVGYVLAGVPVAWFFGCVTFAAAFIPTLGTALVTVPLAAILLALGHPWSALFLAVYGVAVVGLVDNAVRPLLIHQQTSMNGAVLFFALIGGLLAFGPTGLLVGPLAVALFLALVRTQPIKQPTADPRAAPV